MKLPYDEPPLSDLAGQCVLIVEDEVLIAMDLADAFEAAGASVHHARNLSQGMALAETKAIDAAVLDVNLGRGETCAPIAAHLSDRGIPFAVHSGDYEGTGELDSSIDVPLVRKPADTHAVVQAVVRLLDRAG
ncbi:MAG: response regulator [Tranquillimonas sp.]